MNAPETLALPDIQAMPDSRNIAINRVGVKALRYPLRVRSAGGGEQHTVASIDMSVGLPPDVKGTHMSRFVEVMEAHAETLDDDSLRRLLHMMVMRLGADRGSIELRFPYFIRKRAPVSGVESALDHQVVLRARIDPVSGYRHSVEVCVAATSLCPCSKEISDYGAHNQRSHITIEVELAASMPLEELVGIAESEASCEVYGLLKRPDEKYVTERAYDNPKFVEDLVRDIASRLDREQRVRRYTVAAENFESIHNHSAFAEIERDKTTTGPRLSALTLD